jgi:hypothetical protein
MLIKNEAGEEIEVDLDQYADGVKAHFEGKGIFLKSKDELEAEKKAVETETINTTTKKIHSDWESKIGEVVGEKRPDGAKGIDWAIGHVSKLKEKADKPAPIPEPGNNSVATDALNAKLKATEDALTAFKASIENKEKEAKNSAKKTALKSTIKSLNLLGESPAEKAEMVAGLETIIGSKYRLEFDEEEDLVLYEGENLVTDPDAGNAPMRVDKLVQTKFKNFLAAPKEQPKPVGGTGTKQEDVIQTSSDGKTFFKGKSRDEIREKMQAKGHIMGSKTYNEIMAESLKQSGIE